jgi:hypothetical protein
MWCNNCWGVQPPKHVVQQLLGRTTPTACGATTAGAYNPHSMWCNNSRLRSAADEPQMIWGDGTRSRTTSRTNSRLRCKPCERFTPAQGTSVYTTHPKPHLVRNSSSWRQPNCTCWYWGTLPPVHIEQTPPRANTSSTLRQHCSKGQPTQPKACRCSMALALAPR